MLKPEILLTVKLSEKLFVDPKRILLLREIQQCGSINQAAKNIKVSYKSAWDHLQAMHEISPKPLLERNIGGRKGGGTQLTTYTQRLLQLYSLLEQTQEKAFQILHDENVPLNSLLTATAHFSLQSSARNQFFGKVIGIENKGVQSLIKMEIEHLSQPLYASITEKSAVRLQLFLNKEVMIMIKAPWIEINPTNHFDLNVLTGKVSDILDKNDTKEVIISSQEQLQFCATAPHTADLKQGETVNIYIDPEKIILATLF